MRLQLAIKQVKIHKGGSQLLLAFKLVLLTKELAQLLLGIMLVRVHKENTQLLLAINLVKMVNSFELQQLVIKQVTKRKERMQLLLAMKLDSFVKGKVRLQLGTMRGQVTKGLTRLRLVAMLV